MELWDAGTRRRKTRRRTPPIPRPGCPHRAQTESHRPCRCRTLCAAGCAALERLQGSWTWSYKSYAGFGAKRVFAARATVSLAEIVAQTSPYIL